MADHPVEQSLRRKTRIEHALDAQRAYVRRVPDPDNRCRAETNLMTLLEMLDTETRAHAILERNREFADA